MPWWRAVNVQGEAKPGPAGQKVAFVVAGVPETAGGQKLNFAIRSYDDSGNRSSLGNGATAE